MIVLLRQEERRGVDGAHREEVGGSRSPRHNQLDVAEVAVDQRARARHASAIALFAPHGVKVLLEVIEFSDAIRTSGAMRSYSVCSLNAPTRNLSTVMAGVETTGCAHRRGVAGLLRIGEDVAARRVLRQLDHAPNHQGSDDAVGRIERQFRLQQRKPDVVDHGRAGGLTGAENAVALVMRPERCWPVPSPVRSSTSSANGGRSASRTRPRLQLDSIVQRLPRDLRQGERSCEPSPSPAPRRKRKTAW
jgi:hypothetical protein